MATLINGNGNLAIYAQQDADWYAALMGGQTVITAVGNQFAYELLDANTIGVKDGVIITTEGRRIQLDANAIDSFDIPTGAQGTTNYYIIGYHLVTGDLSEQTCETFVQLMENGTDTIPEGSFRDGDDEVFISLYRVEQDDLTIGTITLLLPQLSGSFQSQITELNNDLADIHNYSSEEKLIGKWFNEDLYCKSFQSDSSSSSSIVIDNTLNSLNANLIKVDQIYKLVNNRWTSNFDFITGGTEYSVSVYLTTSNLNIGQTNNTIYGYRIIVFYTKIS